MYRKCYRYEDLIPTKVEFRDEGVIVVNPDKPFGIAQDRFQNIGSGSSVIIDTAAEPVSKISLASDTPNPSTDSPEQYDNEPLSETQSVKTAVSSIKSTFDGVRDQIFKDGKIFGFLETDDLIVILIIVILLAEECEDYVLLLALAAFIFMK